MGAYGFVTFWANVMDISQSQIIMFVVEGYHLTRITLNTSQHHKILRDVSQHVEVQGTFNDGASLAARDTL